MAVGWALAAMVAGRPGGGTVASEAQLAADLRDCLAVFDEQFTAVQADTGRILDVLAEAVGQLTTRFTAMHAALAAVSPSSGSDAPCARAAVREAVAALDRVIDAEAATRHRADALETLAQAVAARVDQAAALVGDIDSIGQEVGLLAGNASIEAVRADDCRRVADAADHVAALAERTHAAGTQIRRVLAVMQALIEQTQSAVAASHARSAADAAQIRAEAAQWLADTEVPAHAAVAAGLDGEAARVVEALQFQDIVGQMVGHLATRMAGMREALAELGAVAQDAVGARDAGAVTALSARAERVGRLLKGVAERGARHPVGHGATPGGSVELF
ncbi:MAG: hypothetical protein DWQ11_11365 [Proteobacteria bacterium]|nr:MAG: hypothetical protein DWQ11_11365 [Pseudomonadota bacterium]